MGSAGAEGLLPSICRGEADHCPQDHGVGDCDAEDVKAPNQEGYHQTLDTIDLDVATRQLGPRHVITVSVGDYIASAVGQALGEESEGNDKQHPSEKGGETRLCNDGICEDS